MDPNGDYVEALFLACRRTRLLLPKLAARSDDGYWALADEIGVCAWRNRKLLVGEMGVCKLTNLTVDKRLLNPDAELIPLRSLLDGVTTGEPLSDSEKGSIRLLAGWEKLAGGNISKILSPSGQTAAVVAEERTMMGFRVRYHGIVIRFGPEAAALAVTPAGSRRDGKWFPL